MSSLKSCPKSEEEETDVKVEDGEGCLPGSTESGDDDSDNSVPYPTMLDDWSDTTNDKDDIGAIDDSSREGSMLNCTDALSVGIVSLCALLLGRSQD